MIQKLILISDTNATTKTLSINNPMNLWKFDSIAFEPKINPKYIRAKINSVSVNES
jgi:hypothetical protein